MRDLAVLFLHLLATVARLASPGGVRAVVAETVQFLLSVPESSPTMFPDIVSVPAVRQPRGSPAWPRDVLFDAY